MSMHDTIGKNFATHPSHTGHPSHSHPRHSHPVHRGRASKIRLHDDRLIARLAVLLLLLPATAILASPAENQHRWIGQEDHIERALLKGVILSKRRLPDGITRPFKVLLEFRGELVNAIWKPIGSRQFSDQHESYQAEIVAYRLSRRLGLDMVPPTVERRIGRRYGSLQLWIEGGRPFAEVAARLAFDASSLSKDLSRMHFFDSLIDNPDRHSANFLVDSESELVLIDHSRSLYFDNQGPVREGSMPAHFDRALVERTRELSAIEVRELLGDVLAAPEVKGLLHLRERLLEHVDRQSDRYGSDVFFGEAPRPQGARPRHIRHMAQGGKRRGRGCIAGRMCQVFRDEP